MEKTSNKNGLKIVLALIVTVALVVGLLLTLSSCSGNDEKGASASIPDVKDATDDIDEGADAAQDPASSGTPSGSTPTGGSNGSTGSTGSAPAGGDQASLEEWINYLKDYDKNVENGVESATDDFTDMIGSVGDSMANGNYGEGAQEFNDGLKDYVGDIFGSLTP